MCVLSVYVRRELAAITCCFSRVSTQTAQSSVWRALPSTVSTGGPLAAGQHLTNAAANGAPRTFARLRGELLARKETSGRHA
jgi:hypothetical protein